MLLLSTAWAYRFTGLDFSWQDLPLEEPFYLDHESFPPGFAPREQVESTVREALRTWNRAGADFRARLSDDPEGAFHIVYVPTVGGRALGLNQSSGDAIGATECEIRMYGANGGGPIDWYFGEPEGMGATQSDFFTVFLHEAGHCFGLDHTNQPDAVMLSSVLEGTVRRELTDDDRDGLIALYGEAPPLPVIERLEEPVAGGCDTSRSGFGRLLSWLQRR